MNTLEYNKYNVNAFIFVKKFIFRKKNDWPYCSLLERAANKIGTE